MFRFVSVTKNYPNRINALDNVSFEIQEGEFVFLVGPSGSGKTTALKLMIREETPTEGKLFFEDLDISNLDRALVYELRRKLGVIFQDFKLLEDKDTYENVSFALEAAGKSEKDIAETVPYVLEIVGLKDRMDAFPKELSGGEKQKVAIARALANNPKVLIADEPTGNLDPAAAWDIIQILSKINNWGTTVIMSTHGSHFVDTLAKRVIRLEGGVIKRDDMKGKYNPIDEFEAKILVDEHIKTENTDQKEITEEKDKEKIVIKPEEEKNDMKKKKIDIKLTEKEETKSIAEPLQNGDRLESKKKKAKKDKKLIDEVDERESGEQTSDHSIENLDLEGKIIATLREAGYDTIESIVDAGPTKIIDLKGIDRKDFKNILSQLKKLTKDEQ